MDEVSSNRWSCFIGSAVVRFLINETEHEVLNLDKLTYAGNLKNIAEVANSSRYQFTQGDIFDRDLLKRTFAEFKPDRSITGPSEFIQTNIVGTYTMLEAALEYFSGKLFVQIYISIEKK